MKELIKPFIILLSGFLQLFLSYFIPVAGGGASMILLLTTPCLIGLGILLSIIYHAFIRKHENTSYVNSFFYGMIMIILFLTFISYPYK